MTSKYYEPGRQRAEKVNALFATIAPRYDLINDLQSFGLHRWWKRRFVRMARARPGEHALDVCCGTGDITLALAQAGADTVGLDFSEPMLAVARARKAGAEHAQKNSTGGQVEFLRGDAQNIPFPDDQFDVVTVSYGLRNLASWERGLAEMLRVTKPGGRVLVLDFGKPDNRLWRAIYFAYLRLFVPLMGRVFFGDPDAYAYILESLHHYPAQRGVAAQMEKLSLRQVRVVNLLGGVMSINYGEKPPANPPPASAGSLRASASA